MKHDILDSSPWIGDGRPLPHGAAWFADFPAPQFRTEFSVAPETRAADYASGVLAESFMRFVPPRQGERCIFDELPYPSNGTGVVFQGARPNFA